MGMMRTKETVNTTWQAWLDSRQAEWEAAQPRPDRNGVAFARYLGIKRNSYINYVNRGVVPNDDNLDRIAAKLGTTAYGVLGRAVPRQDPRRQLRMAADALPPEDQAVAVDLLRALGGDKVIVPGKPKGTAADKQKLVQAIVRVYSELDEDERKLFLSLAAEEGQGSSTHAGKSRKAKHTGAA